METTIFTLIGIFLLPYLLFPILLRVSLRDYYEPHLEAISEDSLPPEVQDYLNSTADGFKQAGFYHCTFARMKNHAGSGEIYISLWFHRPKGVSAYSSLAYIRLLNQPVKVFAKSMCLITRFSEASQFETSTSGVPTPLAKNPLFACIQLPKRMGFQELFGSHQILAQKFNPTSERLLPQEGEELILMKRKIMQIHQYQIQAGRWALDDAANLYHLTWKGAVINGWQHAWPIKALRKWMLEKQAEKLLESIKGL